MNPSLPATKPAPALGRRQCRHCGTPFAPQSEADHFCCAGCEAVSAMILAQGFGHFYDLRKGISKPAGDLAPHDFGWLRTLTKQAEADALAGITPKVEAQAGAAPQTEADTVLPATTATESRRTVEKPVANALLVLPISGIHCAGCRWLIHQLFTQQPGHDTCELDDEGLFIRFSWEVPAANVEDAASPPFQTPATTKAVAPQAAETPQVTDLVQAIKKPEAAETVQAIEAPQATETASKTKAGGHFDPIAFADMLHNFGYTLGNPALPRTTLPGKTAPAAASPRKRLAPRLLLCAVFALNAIIFSLPMRLGADAEEFPFLRLFGLVVFLCATLCVGLAASYFWKQTLAFPQKNPTGSTTESSRTGGIGSSRATPLRRVSLRRLVACALVALWLIALLGQSLGLPAVFAPDVIAVTSLAALLIAFAVKR